MRSTVRWARGVGRGEATPRVVGLSGVLISMICGMPLADAEAPPVRGDGGVNKPPDPDDTDSGVWPKWGDIPKKGDDLAENGPARTSAMVDGLPTSIA
eukprot:3123033-Alexandrium_andersonii.AAC.1